MKDLMQPGASDVLQPVGERRLTATEFQHLATVPAAVEWFANINNPRTRCADQNNLGDFYSIMGLTTAEEFRAVTRAHFFARRVQLEQSSLAGATTRFKLAALASLFDKRCTFIDDQGPPAGI